MIYFVQAVDGGPIKIGCSGDVVSRIRQLENCYRRPLALLATMEGGQDREREIHERFAHLRFGRTEQFRPGRDLMDFIARPLFVNQSDVELMEVENARLTIINLKGSPEQAEWLEHIHRKTHLPKSVIMRLALAEWTERHGHEPFPAMEGE